MENDDKMETWICRKNCWATQSMHKSIIQVYLSSNNVTTECAQGINKSLQNHIHNTPGMAKIH